MLVKGHSWFQSVTISTKYVPSRLGIILSKLRFILDYMMKIRQRPTCITVTAPYVIAIQYMEPRSTPPAMNGQILWVISSIASKSATNAPIDGNTTIYSALHWGHSTFRVMLPLCFSSTHRCKQLWCTWNKEITFTLYWLCSTPGVLIRYQ